MTEGYPKLAVLQGTYPQLGIYRRFATLNARNLLYYQAELVDLEERLDKETLEDLKATEEKRKSHSRDWYSLSKTADGVPTHQWDIMLKIREKLLQYNACLIQQQQLVAFDPPEEGNLQYLQAWLIGEGQGDYRLEGLDRDVWKDSKDLLVVPSDNLSNLFGNSISKGIFELYHRFVGSKRPPTDVENGLYKYDHKSVHGVADVAATLLASLMPMVSIFVLYSIHNMWIRLGMVAVFTMMLSLALALFTKSRGIEIFAATASFASVQVVFVGSTSI